MRPLTNLFFFFLVGLHSITAQQTLGTISLSSDAANGYTLISPVAGQTTYLINNCGKIINTWESPFRAGLAAYLSPDGTLTRAGKSNGNLFTIGGAGGLIEQFDWEGNLLWRYIHTSELVLQHHDIHVLDNGNILFLSVERKTEQEAIAAGRDTNFIDGRGLYDDVVYEIDPTTDELVWRWSLWDHMIQEFDASKANFGNVSDHPERVDINYTKSPSPDFIHFNSLDYDAERDQILLSSKNLGEIFIIDHSTTTAEAAGTQGGDAGIGGDLLYRWGQTSNYGIGDMETTQKFYRQHSARYIWSGKDAGKILVFNNGTGRPGTEQYSTIETIEIVRDSLLYAKSSDGSFLPTNQDWIFDADKQFYSSSMSSCVRLENDHTLICYANKGQVLEIDENDNTVWSYIVPTRNGTPQDQGAIPVTNDIFHTIKYSSDYFDTNIPLEVGSEIEGNPEQSFCFMSNSSDIEEEIVSKSPFYPNPSQDILYSKVFLEDIRLQSVTTGIRYIIPKTQSLQYNISTLPTGVYILSYIDSDGQTQISKLIKQ